MPNFGQDLFRDVQDISDGAAEGQKPLRMWVVDEVDGLVRLATALDVTNGYEPMTARYPRVKGEPFAPGDEVQVQQRGPADYYVLGAVQVGGGEYKQTQLAFENSGAVIATGPTTIDAGSGINASYAAGQVQFAIDYTAVATTASVADKQRQLSFFSSPAAGGSIVSIQTNPQFVVAQDGGGLVFTPATNQVDLAVNWGALGETDTTKVPRASNTNRRMLVYDNGALKVTDPGGIDYGDGLTVTPQGDGFVVAATGGSGGASTPIIPTTAVWLSALNTFATRNGTGVTMTAAANQLYGTPFRVTAQTEFDQLGFSATTAAGSYELAIYKLSATGMQMTLVLNTGSNAVVVGWNTITFGWAANPGTGIYVACVCYSGAPTVRGIAAGQMGESPWPLPTGYTPATNFNGGNTYNVAQGIQQSRGFGGSWASTVTLTAAQIVSSTLPLVWALAMPD